MTDSPVIAVGRMLKPKHGEPRVHQRLKLFADGRALATTSLLQAGTKDVVIWPDLLAEAAPQSP